MARQPILAALALGIAIAINIAPSSADEPWRPVAPEGLPASFDWIRLKSDEWLKGEIISMYDDMLEFDSDELGKLSFDFEDIREIRTAHVVQVGFARRSPAIGQLTIDGDQVRVVGERGESEFARNEILSLIIGRPKEINYWSAYAKLGGNIRSGNTSQVDYSGRFGAMRRTVRNRIAFDYLGNITRIDSEDTSNNHRATLGWDLFVSKKFYVNVVGAEWYRDPFQNIDHRWTLNSGLGYQIINGNRATWTVDAGPAWQSTTFVSVPDNDDEVSTSPAFRIGSRFDHELTDDIDIYVDLEALFTDTKSGTYNHHVDTGIDLDLMGNLDFTLSWVWDRIEDPRPAEDGSVPKQDDYRIIVGLGWDF